MSDPPPRDQRDGQERDLLPFGKILGVGVLGIAIGAGAIWWSSRMDHPRAPQVVAADRVAPSERRAVEDSLLGANTAAVDLRQRQERELAGWAWVDRAQGVASVPIDVAMDAWLARQARTEEQR